MLTKNIKMHNSISNLKYVWKYYRTCLFISIVVFNLVINSIWIARKCVLPRYFRCT